MRAAGGGAIVNLASVSAARGSPELCAYDASKGGVRQLGREFAAYFSAEGAPIRVNTVLPGVVDTPMVSQFFKDDPKGLERWLRGQKLRRLCQPEEVAGLVALLLSSEARFAQGGDFFIDGGAAS